ncbi:MAG: hypothetical protein ABJ004_00260 [Cyclobacteriaceae bacterium]
MKKITKIERLGNGKTKVRFSFPLTAFEYLFLLTLGTALLILSVFSIKQANSLSANILISALGIFGLLLIVGFFDLVAQNFRTLIIDKQSGTAVINGILKKSLIPINEVSHVLVKKKRNSGLSNSNGFIQGPDIIASSINVQLKNGKSIKLIPLRGIPVNKKNANSQLSELSKNSAKDIANLLSVKVLTE